MKGMKTLPRLPIVLAMIPWFACGEGHAQRKMKLVQDGCPVTEDQVRKDAAELGPLLLQGSLELYRRFTGRCGYHRERECALQGFIQELHLIDPDDVKLTVTRPCGHLGHTFHSFPEGSPDPDFKGYDINTWRLISQNAVEEIFQHVSASSVVTVNINKSIEPTDRGVFMQDFKKQRGTIPFDIRQNEIGELVVFPTEN